MDLIFPKHPKAIHVLTYYCQQQYLGCQSKILRPIMSSHSVLNEWQIMMRYCWTCVDLSSNYCLWDSCQQDWSKVQFDCDRYIIITANPNVLWRFLVILFLSFLFPILKANVKIFYWQWDFPSQKWLFFLPFFMIYLPAVIENTCFWCSGLFGRSCSFKDKPMSIAISNARFWPQIFGYKVIYWSIFNQQNYEINPFQS